MSGLVVIDSGGANLGSVRNALLRLSVDAPVTLDANLIRAADRDLPGVGAAPIMRRMRDSGVAELAHNRASRLLTACNCSNREGRHALPLGLLSGDVSPPHGVRAAWAGINCVRPPAV